MGDSSAAKSKPNSNSALPTHSKDEAYLQTVIPKCQLLFESIKSQQRIQRLSLSPDPIQIVLPDGKVKEGKKWNTTPSDVAKEISKSLSSNALIAKVDGLLWDMHRPLEGDCELALSLSIVMRAMRPFGIPAHTFFARFNTQAYYSFRSILCIGPCATRGEEKQPFERIEVTQQQALKMFSDNPFKVEIINDLPEDKTLTVNRCGHLVDLCRGPHILNTSFVKAFSCLKASSAYWRGNKDRESLQRFYGISYPDQKHLKEYKTMLPGSCFFLPHGARVCSKLLEFIRSQYWKRGYEEVWTANM
ncbi:Threonine--tRNA ligase, mitochondrial [Olea europaea subsp. europaea]|uniref:threonine--tRNA ligase n=1 Tax=Olea europaea subsp. europaea TaxID=158383 RepID=A0A8S0PU92_OLEEU|nr:Threonine--tRNA ligase, mitochondrial [Olea europaea subsp. europaea]